MNAHPRPTITDYAPVNGLQMYYEIYGSGQPLVLLHGGMTTIEDFGLVLPALAQTRQVIAFERQGHGHTADIDRPFSMEHWADDTAALLQHLNIDQADIFGYSTGGSVALAFALRHPKRVRSLVLASTIYNREGYYPGIMEGLLQATPDQMPDILRDMYTRVAPHPENWPNLIKKSVESVSGFKGWHKKDIRTISAPTMVLVGDSDIVRTEHAVDLYRLIPKAKLAVLPDTDHISIMVQHAEWTAAMITDFLSTTVPETVPEQAQTVELGQLEHDFPKAIGRPATDALLAAGYTRLAQLTVVREVNIQGLHGIGPKAIKTLRAALAEKGLSFAD